MFPKKIISFELTDKFVAWHADKNGLLMPTKLHAIALWEGLDGLNGLVGVEFAEDGVEIVQDDENFVCMLPEGVSPSVGLREACARDALAVKGRQV